MVLSYHKRLACRIGFASNHRLSNYNPSSGVFQRINTTMTISMLTDNSTNQTVTFSDATPQWIAGFDAPVDEVRLNTHQDSLSLADFFKRPVMRTAIPWTVGLPLSYGFNPWSTFFGNKRVINRINNFRLMNAKLHVKFMLNGTGFHYGRALIDYIPLPAMDTCTLSSASNSVYAVTATQRMHAYLDPATNIGVELVLPTVWHEDNLDITTADWSELGVITLRDLNILKHSNGATGALDITVAIWATDVELSIPTTVSSIAMVNQSGVYVRPVIEVGSPTTAAPASPVITTAIDCHCCWPRYQSQSGEYGQGAISHPASALARAMGLLTKIPYIGGFARATALTASGVAGVTKLFGYSRPAIIADIGAMRPTYAGTMSTCDGGDLVSKLTVDSQQELTIDPAVVGVTNSDELVIADIAKREAYLTTFNWAVGVFSGTTLWNVRVNPHMFIHSSSMYHSLPCHFASLPFKYWRGMMHYHFTVVASSYHRGRLQITWDPVYVNSLETNLAYTRVIDIANEHDFIISVPWGQHTSYLPTPPVSTTHQFSTTPYTSESPYSNGVLSVAVLNELTVPDIIVNNDIFINVTAYCVDFEPQQLSGDNISDISYFNQSSEYQEDVSSAPVAQCDDDCMMECSPAKNLDLVYFGETLVSFRTLLKRYAYSTSMYSPGVIADIPTKPHQITMWARAAFPYFRGYNASGIHGTSNQTNTTLLNYLTPAFLAQRGGIRHKFIVSTDGDLANMWVTRNAARATYGVVGYSINYPGYASLSNPEFGYNTAYVSTFKSAFTDGAALTAAKHQPVLEVEVPHYSNRRFKCARNINNEAFNGPVNINDDGIRLHVTSKYVVGGHVVVDDYVSVAEDFSLSGFQGMPPWTIMA